MVESPGTQNSLFREFYKQRNQMSMIEIITDEKRMNEGKVRVVGFMENVARDACRDVFIALCTYLKSYLMSRIVL